MITSRDAFLTLESAYLKSSDDAPLPARAPVIRDQRQLSSSDLESVCRWKSPRALPLVRSNTDEEVREVTRWSLTTPHERLRIRSLQLLRGVSWPMASVVLHWFHTDPYPILDVRALWSLDVAAPQPYTFQFWWDYVRRCRELKATLSLSMRTIDRALWQYSKENGGPGTAA
jgi:hypothetical protein